MRLPWLIFSIITTTLFLLFLPFPYTVEFDVVAQLRGVQEWLALKTDLLNTFLQPKFSDLSQDWKIWMSWYPPGVSILYLPLMSLGLPLGIATRITGVIFFILGGLGWFHLLNKLQISTTIRVLVAIILPIYSITIVQWSGLGSGDVLLFPVISWLLVYTLSVTNKPTVINSIIIGFLLGLVYWVKYSGFTISLGILLYLSLNFLIIQRFELSLKKRCLMVGLILFSIAIPFFTLQLLHLHYGKLPLDLYNEHYPFTKGIGILFSFFSSIGLGLLQLEMLVQRLTIRENLVNANLYWSSLVKVIVGLWGTIIVLFSTFYVYRNQLYPYKIILLMLTTNIFPFIILSYLSNRTGYNFSLFHVYRFVFPVALISIIFILTTCFHLWQISDPKSKLFRRSYVAIALITIILPLLFNITYYTRRLQIAYSRSTKVSSELIYNDRLSKIDVPSVISQIDSLIKSDRDVVVWNSIFFGDSTILTIKHRILLISSTGHSPIPGYPEPSDKIMTSQNLRVILVLPKDFTSDQIKTIQQKFIQAKPWNFLPPNPKAEVLIWYTDLIAAPQLKTSSTKVITK